MKITEKHTYTIELIDDFDYNEVKNIDRSCENWKFDSEVYKCAEIGQPVVLDDYDDGETVWKVTLLSATETDSRLADVEVCYGYVDSYDPQDQDEHVGNESIGCTTFAIELEFSEESEDLTEGDQWLDSYNNNADDWVTNHFAKAKDVFADDEIDGNKLTGIEPEVKHMSGYHSYNYWEESINNGKITLNSLKRLLIESIAADEASEEAEQDADDAPVSGSENLEDVLNSLLGDEYNAWKQYTMMLIAAKGKSLARVEEVFKNAASEEMYDHFENLYKWMQSTGMKPVNDPDELNKICGCPFVKVEREQDTVSLVELAVKAENAAIDAYSKALEMDIVKAYPDLVYLLSEFLKDERGHLRELQDVQTQMNGFDGNESGEEEVVDDAE